MNSRDAFTAKEPVMNSNQVVCLHEDCVCRVPHKPTNLFARGRHGVDVSA
jgi:hypothetical protein